MPPQSSPKSVSESSSPSGSRPAQRRRTRKAIVDATVALIGQGCSPSVDDIAVAADVSRRTIYMYFRSLDQLLLDAATGALSQAGVEAALGREVSGDDPAGRVEALVTALLGQSPIVLPLGRQIIRLTVSAPPPEVPEDGVRRGYRRIEWIERALEPARVRLTEEQFERLVSALALVIGWEAMIVLQDLRGLDRTEERTVATWAARVLVEAMLAEVADPPRT